MPTFISLSTQTQGNIGQSIGWIIIQKKSELKPTQVFFVHDCKMFDVANWVAHLNGGDDPGETPSHETLSVSPQGALEISSVIGQPPFLVGDLFSSPRVVAESHKRNEGCRPLSSRPQIFTDTPNKGRVPHLRAKGLWSDKEKGYT